MTTIKRKSLPADFLDPFSDMKKVDAIIEQIETLELVHYIAILEGHLE